MKQNKDREEFEKDWQYEFDNLKKKFRLNRFRWEYQKEVIIGWVVNTFFEDVIEHPDIQKFLQSEHSKWNKEILKEMEFNGETDNFELDVNKAEKLFNNFGYSGKHIHRYDGMYEVCKCGKQKRPTSLKQLLNIIKPIKLYE